MSIIIKPEDSLTQHLSTNEIKKLNKRTESIIDKKVDKLVENLLSNKPFLDKSIWNPKKFEEIQLISYKALLEGKITLNQFATCCLVVTSFEQFQAKFLKVSIDSDLSKTKKERQIVANKAREIKSEFGVVLEPDSSAISDKIHTNIAFKTLAKKFVEQSYSSSDIDSAGFDKLIANTYFELTKKIKNMRASERLFFSYKIPLKQKNLLPFSGTEIKHIKEISPMLNVLVNNLKVPFLQAEQTDDHIKVTFPSYSIIQALLEISNPQGIKPVLVFGELKPKEIREHFEKGEVPINIKTFVAQLLKDGELVQWADGFAAGPFAFIFHDIYHAWKKSMLSLMQLQYAQSLIHTLVKFRNKLLQIKKGKSELTNEIEEMLNRKNFEKLLASNDKKIIVKEKLIKFKKFILIFIKLREKLSQIGKRNVETTSKKQTTLSREMNEKITRAVRIIGSDIWSLSDMDFSGIRNCNPMNLKFMEAGLSPFVKVLKRKEEINTSQLLVSC